jgi:FkbM family methyltransferase
MIVPGTGVDLIEDQDQVVALVARRGDFEPLTIKTWLKVVRPGSTAVDVGAYSGLYAIAAARAGARAVAIEPLPLLYARLIENAQRNGVDIRVLQVAASHVDGVAHFWSKGGLSSTSRLGEFPGSKKKIQVETVRLDSLQLDDVSAIKVDVEGFESLVVRGALAILERDRPALILEALEGSGAIADELKPLGYELCERLDGRNFLFKPVAV